MKGVKKEHQKMRIRAFPVSKFLNIDLM